MAQVKPVDIRAMSDDQISKRLKDLHKEEMNLRFQQVGGQLENTSAFKKARREKAQLKTVQTERLKGINTDVKAAAPAKQKKTSAKKAPAKKTAEKK